MIVLIKLKSSIIVEKILKIKISNVKKKKRKEN